MDKLKEAMNRLRSAKPSTETGWVRKGDLIKQQTDQYLAEKKREEEAARLKLQKELEETGEYYKKKDEECRRIKEGDDFKQPVSPSKRVTLETASPTAAQEATIKLSKKEIMNRLRNRKQPVTLFGEDDIARYRRLCKYEQEAPG